MNSEDNLRLRGFKNILEESIFDSKQVFIVAHSNPDLDAIGSAIGLYMLVKNKFKKDCYIILNEPIEKLEAGVKKVVERERNKIPFINLKKYLELKGEDDLLLLTDVNKVNRISVTDYIKDFKNIIIIDHHEEDGFTVETDKKFITCGVSSASEIVTRLSCDMKSTIEPNTATYLLSGIKLDTCSYSKNSDPDTMDMVKKLMKSGANNDHVQKLFQENYESDVRVNDLIKTLEFHAFRYALGVATKDEVYTREELAKAADRALSYGNDASFILGYLDEDRHEVGVSARSNGKIHVGHIMEELGGGGNDRSAATTSTEKSAEELGDIIRLKLKNPYSLYK